MHLFLARSPSEFQPVEKIFQHFFLTIDICDERVERDERDEKREMNEIFRKKETETPQQIQQLDLHYRERKGLEFRYYKNNLILYPPRKSKFYFRL